MYCGLKPSANAFGFEEVFVILVFWCDAMTREMQCG